MEPLLFLIKIGHNTNQNARLSVQLSKAASHPYLGSE